MSCITIDPVEVAYPLQAYVDGLSKLLLSIGPDEPAVSLTGEELSALFWPVRIHCMDLIDRLEADYVPVPGLVPENNKEVRHVG